MNPKSITNIPVLFTTYNRLDFTKQSLQALAESDSGDIYVIDNHSTDGTISWLLNQRFEKLYPNKNIILIMNKKNVGVAGAMNQFIEAIRKDFGGYNFAAKVDNDTIVPKDFFSKMRSKFVLGNCEFLIDVLQSKHPILKATHPLGFDYWVKNTMKHDLYDKSIFYNHFVGGSGIVFRLSILRSDVKIPETEWALGGWREFQKMMPKEIVKAFTTDVEIKLLDMNDEGGANYPSAYSEYYRKTKRL